MKLPWNRKYLEIGFHIIITVLILMVMIGILFRLPDAKNVISETARNFLAVFAPFFWALFFTLFLEPLVFFWQDFYEKRCTLRRRSAIKNRKAGTALAFFSVALVLFLLGGFLAKRIGDTDIHRIISQISTYIRRMGDVLVLLNLKLAEAGVLANVEGLLALWTEQLTLWIESWIIAVAGSIPAIGGNLLDVLIGLVVSFYFLMEKQSIVVKGREWMNVFLGKKAAGMIRVVSHEIYSVFSGYLSGQMIDAGIMAVLFSCAFLILGLPHGVFLGVLSGFSNLIPYFGAVTAFFLSVSAGLLSGTPVKAVYASVLILLLQQADSIFIVPRVVGRRVKLHPALVLLSLAFFGRLFGFWGVFLAVPLGALCKNGFLWLYERKRN